MTPLSNYPPGHPTGVSHGEETEIFSCDECNYFWVKEELISVNDVSVGDVLVCKFCRKQPPRAECEQCGAPSTHLDVDEAVNACTAYCSQHHM